MGPEAASSDREDETRRRILHGALSAIGETGITRLSMRGVAEAAGVSRGTVYRYFESKQAVLFAVAEFDQRRYSQGVREAVAAATPGINQLRAHLKYSFDFLANHPARWMVEHEPLFLLGFLAEQLPAMARALEGSLGEVLEGAAVLRSGRLKKSELADLIVRILMSAYLLPGANEEAPLEAIEQLVTEHFDPAWSKKRKVSKQRSRTP
jgi:AcrR family transcriptional regulator